MGRTTIVNSITSPELISQINPKNKRLGQEFLDYLKSIQRSPQTIRVYKNDLDIFWVFVLQYCDNKDFVKITKRDIIAYQNWLIETHKNSPARIRRLKAVLSSLSNYIENILDDDPEFEGFRSIVKKIESPPNQPVRPKTVLTDNQLNHLLSTLIAERRFDQACLIALGAYSGRRKAELLRFKVSYFDDSCLICNGGLYKTPEMIKTKGRGVNGKLLYCYTIAKPFYPYFSAWMKYREEQGIESQWLFPNPSDYKEPLPESTIQSWTVKFSRILGVDFYMHSLRHLFTTNLAKANIPDSVVQSLVGWESADMLNVYKDIEPEDEFEKYFDSDGVKEVKSKSLNDL